MIKLNILSLKSICEKESYDLFDKYIRKLPRKSDGSYDLSSGEFYDNDVDAVRHAYASGVFTHEYGEKVTEILDFFAVKTETGKIVIHNLNLETPKLGEQVRFCKMRNIKTTHKDPDFLYKQI